MDRILFPSFLLTILLAALGGCGQRPATAKKPASPKAARQVSSKGTTTAPKPATKTSITSTPPVAPSTSDAGNPLPLSRPESPGPENTSPTPAIPPTEPPAGKKLDPSQALSVADLLNKCATPAEREKISETLPPLAVVVFKPE